MSLVLTFLFGPRTRVDVFEWWVTNVAGLERMVRSAGFALIEVGEHLILPAAGSGPWEGTGGTVGGYA